MSAFFFSFFFFSWTGGGGKGVGLFEFDFELCIGQIEASTSPPREYPGHLTPLPSREGGNLILRVFHGVGNLIPMR